MGQLKLRSNVSEELYILTLSEEETWSQLYTCICEGYEPKIFVNLFYFCVFLF